MAKIASASVGNFAAVFFADRGQDALRKSLEKVKCPAAKIDAFFKAFEKNYASITSDLQEVRTAATNRSKGTELLHELHQKGRKVLEDLFAATTNDPEFEINTGKFTVELQFQGGKIELWYLYAGAKELKLAV